MSANNDRELTCADCGRGFTWSAAEQDYFQQQGYEPPKRYKLCQLAKQARLAARGQHGGAERGGAS